jgi:hypothetical protein
VSEATKIQARFQSFAADFVHPLLAGGTAVVGQPLTPGMLEHFSLAVSGDLAIDREIYDLLHGEASEIAPLRALVWPERGLMAVTMAAHNLVAVTDPKLDRLFARGARKKALEYADWLIDAAGAPNTRGEALARHAIISRFVTMSRTDVVVKNWAYTYRFFGRPVPTRVTAMPRVRMVKQDRTEKGLLQLFDVLDAELSVRTRLRSLVQRSPVTEFLHTERFGAPAIGTAALAVLSDDLVRNGIARELVSQGASVMAPIGEALANLADQRPPPRLLFYLLALIYEAHVIAILDARAGREPVFARPQGPAASLFVAVLPAMVGAPDDLGALLELDPDDLLALRRRAGKLDVAAGPEACKRAVELVDYAEPPRLDHERPAPAPINEVHP